MNTFSDIKEKIENSKKIAIFTHISPDGDCLGSGTALRLMLRKLGKEADVFCDDKINVNFQFITKDYFNQEFNDKYDLMIAVDCSDIKRLGNFEKPFTAHKNTLTIDHHITNTLFSITNYVEGEASSTCEILYKFFKFAGYDLDDEIATDLYSGLCTDTGCFMHNNTKPITHKVAGELLEYNICIDDIHYSLFKRTTLKQIELLRAGLGNLKLSCNGKVAIIGLSNKDTKKLNATEEDSVGLVNYAVNIEGVEVAIGYRETDEGDSFKVSIRSKKTIDVSKIAQFFGGGGHRMASGCKLYGKGDTICKKLVEKACEVVKQTENESEGIC